VPYTLISYNDDLLIQLVDFLVQSPQAVSPSTLSPTSLSSRQMGRFSFGGSPQDSQGPSPGHSPSTRRRQYPQHLQNLVIGGPQSPTQLTQTAVSFKTCHYELRFCMYVCKACTKIRHLASFERAWFGAGKTHREMKHWNAHDRLNWSVRILISLSPIHV
jgi:hypothetical protein